MLRVREGKSKLAKILMAGQRVAITRARIGMTRRLHPLGARAGRRAFLSFVAAVAANPSSLLRAQQAMPAVGFLNSRSPEEAAPNIAAFRKGLAEAGYIEGRNVLLELRWAEGRFDRLPALAAELAAERVAVIAATGGEPAALAARAAAPATPIVFAIGCRPGLSLV
jgi:putative ABC transport system substrate-binding protein